MGVGAGAQRDAAFQGSGDDPRRREGRAAVVEARGVDFQGNTPFLHGVEQVDDLLTVTLVELEARVVSQGRVQVTEDVTVDLADGGDEGLEIAAEHPVHADRGEGVEALLAAAEQVEMAALVGMEVAAEADPVPRVAGQPRPDRIGRRRVVARFHPEPHLDHPAKALAQAQSLGEVVVEVLSFEPTAGLVVDRRFQVFEKGDHP